MVMESLLLAQLVCSKSVNYIYILDANVNLFVGAHIQQSSKYYAENNYNVLMLLIHAFIK